MMSVIDSRNRISVDDTRLISRSPLLHLSHRHCVCLCCQCDFYFRLRALRFFLTVIDKAVVVVSHYAESYTGTVL
jgi:hypothetical protein